MPHPRDRLSSQLDYEGWRDLLRAMCGRYYSEGIEPISFSGWVRPVNVRGFTALDIGSNAQRVERTYQDVRRDGADHYFALFPVSGQLAMIHNDQAVRLAVGDVALVDAARPVTYSADNGDAMEHRFAELPRQSLVSHLGFEPQGGLYRRRGTPAGRLLFDLIRTPGKLRDQRSRQPIPRWSWRSMICWRVICTNRAIIRLTSCGQAVRAHPQHHQGWLCRSGFRSS